MASPGAAPTSARLRRLGPFRRQPFLVYWTGGFVSNVGTWLQTVAASVYVYERTGSTLAVGILNFASFLPIFLFSVIGGVIGDRFDRRTVVITTHAVSGVLACVLAGIAFAGAASEIAVIVIAFLLNTSYAVAKPALVSILPAIVPRDELTDSVGVNTLQFVIAQMAGPVLAAIVIAGAGVSWAFALNALSYVGPIAAMAWLWRRGLASGTAPVKAGAAAAGGPLGSVGYVRDHRWVLALLAGVVACSAPLEVVRTLSPAMAEGLGQPESAAGYLVAAMSVGSAIALFAFVPLRRSGRSRDLARAGLAFEAVGLLGGVLSGQFWTAAIFLSLIGFGFSLCFPVLTSELQAEVPDAVRGRIMAFHQMSHLGNRPFAALAAGAAAALVGAQPAIAIALALIPLGLVAAARAWRSLDAEADASSDTAVVVDGPVTTRAAGSFE
jgi:MFS family permease